MGRESSVGIATRYGLEGPGIESRWGGYFLHPSRPALGPTQPPIIIIIIIIIIIMIMMIIIIIIIYCNWVVTRWQWLFYMYTKHEIGYY